MAGKTKTSEFSATMIGVHDKANKNDNQTKLYREEAKEISKYLTSVHHARKLPAMQLNYSETVNKLSKIQGNVPLAVAPPAAAAPVRHSRDHKQHLMKEEQFYNNMRQDIKKETYINDRKARYNFAMGQKAQIKEIFEGTAAIPKNQLFPQKATHLQVLALTGALKMPDANTLPPDVPARKRWLGDNVGWE